MMVYPSNCYGRSISNTYRHELGNTPFRKPQMWDLSIPKMKDEELNKGPEKRNKREECVKERHFRVKKGNSGLPLVLSLSKNSASTRFPSSPPKAKNRVFLDLTIPSLSQSPRKRHQCAENLSKRKKHKVTQRSRIICGDETNSEHSVIFDSYRESQEREKHVPVPWQSKSKQPPLSHKLIQQGRFDLLLQRALENQMTSMTIIKYLVEMYVKNNLLPRELSFKTIKIDSTCLYLLLQRTFHDNEYKKLLCSFLQYFSSKRFFIFMEKVFFHFVKNAQCRNESHENTIIEIIQCFLDVQPNLLSKSFGPEGNTLLHLIILYQSSYPCSKLIKFILSANENNDKNILLIANNLKQFPLHLVMLKRHSITSEIIQLVIKQSLQQQCLDAHDSSLVVLQEDEFKCTPFHYLWFTRVSKQYECEKEVNFELYDSLYRQSLEKVKDAESSKNQDQVNILVDMLFGSCYVQILNWFLTYSFPNLSPLHAATKIPYTSANIVSLLMLLHPHQLLEQDTQHGKTPLHYAASTCVEKLKVLLQNQKSLEEGIKIRDASQNLPLHYLLMNTNSSKLTLVQTLVKHYPESIEFKSSKLYPFMMATLPDENSHSLGNLDVAYFLLRMSPSLIN